MVLIGGITAKVGIDGEGPGEDSSYRMGGRSGPTERSVVMRCLGRLCEPWWFGLFGRDVWRFDAVSFLGKVVDGVGSALQHSAAAWASVARPVAAHASAAGREDGPEFAARHLHFQTLLQLQGFKRESTRCRESGGTDDREATGKTSRRPLGSAGTMGMYLRDFVEEDGRSKPREGASSCGQLHLECTRRACRSSRHFSHCETGRPFFLISKSGRSV